MIGLVKEERTRGRVWDLMGNAHCRRFQYNKPQNRLHSSQNLTEKLLALYDILKTWMLFQKKKKKGRWGKIQVQIKLSLALCSSSSRAEFRVKDYHKTLFSFSEESLLSLYLDLQVYRHRFIPRTSLALLLTLTKMLQIAD